jgi:hypothetical protein
MRILRFIERVPVRINEWLKKTFKTRTYKIELIVAFGVLAVTALVSGKGLVEWIGVAAVFFSFAHMSVADRLREREEARKDKGEVVLVECFYKLDRYFMLKEICWFAYFLLLGAWSALAGVFLFLVYPLWRRVWRKYHPLKR